MHHLNEIHRLNALAAADALYPRLPAERPRLHPLVRDSIASIEQGRPLSAVQDDARLAEIIFPES